MPDTARSEVRISPDADLALPRPPGVIRRFWARHPLFADILIALLCLLFSLGAASLGASTAGSGGAAAAAWGMSVVILVLLLATSTGVLFRRRVPLVPFTLAIALQATTVIAPHGAAVAPLVVSTYALAVYGSNRLCVLASAVGTAAVAVVSLGVLAAMHPGVALLATLNTFFNTALCVVLGALVGVNVGNRKRYLAAVIERSRRLLVEREQQAELAAAAERERIAREMHDIVSHSLTVIVALAEGANATRDADRAHQAMEGAATTARTALTEMRAMLGVLRADGPAMPLAPAQAIAPADVVAGAQRAGFPATLTTTGPAVEQAAIAYAIGRIVQEGLTNAMRHAPAARGIHVRVDRIDDAVHVSVTNDGVTGSREAPGYGIRGLQERARRVGGTLESGPAAAGCWRLRATLPLDAATKETS